MVGYDQARVLDRRVVLSLAYYSAWIFDVQTRGTQRQAFLVSSSPGDSILTADSLAEVTTVIRDAIIALPNVTSCKVTLIDAGLTPPWNAGGYSSLVFDNSWVVSGYNVTTGSSETPSQSWYAQQVTDASEAVQSAFAAIPGVNSCTKAAQPIVTPRSIRPIDTTVWPV